MKMELRFNQSDFKTNDDGSLTVSGYVNKTEQFSELLGHSKRFREKIAKGAFSNGIRKAKEIHFLAEHDSKRILASTRNGSLQLTEDENGLYMEANITPTSWGNDYYELIKSGILQNMSFGFKAIKDSWKKVNGYLERTVHDLELFEVSVVRDPAYSNSTISARGIDLVDDVEIPNFQDVIGGTHVNKKALIEKRNELSEQLNEINNQLNEKKEVRNMIEVLNYNDKAVEERAFTQFLQGRYYEEELRAITTGSAPGNLLVPTTISNEIVQKLVETGQLFGKTKMFQSQSGFLEVLREKVVGEAGFIGEMTNINPLDYEMDKVKLEQKRVGTAIELSQHLINDAGFDINSYVMNLLVRRIATTIDRGILTGDSTQGSFEGILTATLPTESVVSTAAVGALGADDLLEMFNSMHPSLVEGAVFIMNRKTFSRISKLKDGNGQYLVTSIKGGNEAKDHYKLFGLEVVISDAMPDVSNGAKAVVLVNLSEAVAVMVKKGMNMKKIDADTTQALRGSALFVADIYMDAKILNTQALRVLTVKSV